MLEDRAALHRAVLGAVTPQDVRAWLDRHVQSHLGTSIHRVDFAAGDVGAVFGLRLGDGREVVLKALRSGAGSVRLRAVLHCQRLLAQRGFPCADVLDGPSATDGVLAVVEERLSCTSSGSPHDPAARAAMAAGLARQIHLLRDEDGTALASGRPAWAVWDRGAWPAPHDPVFDFATPVEGFEWIDRAADAAAADLRAEARDLPLGVGHSDWVWQNVCVYDGRLLAAYDWDSLVWAPESVVVGLDAGAFSQGSPVPPDAPSWAEAQAFVADYETARGAPFTATERRVVDAAARWVRCYNARCQVDNQVRRGLGPPAGSFVEQVPEDPSRLGGHSADTIGAPRTARG